MEWTDVLDWLEDDVALLRVPKKYRNGLMVQLWNHDGVRSLINFWLKDHYNNKASKSVAKAQDFKTIGNKQFEMKQYVESIQSYTKCALYAPADSCELPIAYANRSASLFYLDRYDDCIKDIKLAVKLNYPKKLHHKIYLRMLQCYLKLGEQQLAEETLFKIQEMIHDPIYVALSMKDSVEKKISEITLSKSNTESKKQNISRLSKLKSQIAFEENDNFSGASVSIDKKYNGEYGRYVVANRLIKRGEILFVEKPLTLALVNYGMLSDRCQHCSRLNEDVPVLCKTCLYTCYCGEECLNKAWLSYHCWECPANNMNILKKIGLGHLALKAFLTCSTTKDKAKRDEMENLVSNFDDIPLDDLKGYGILAIMLTTYLSEYTNFFETVKFERSSMKKFCHNAFSSKFNNEQFYVSSLLVQYVLQLICNGFSIPNTNVSLDTKEQEFVATAVYLSATMLNHSCDPNTFTMFVDQYLIVRAAKDILADEEVFTCYGPQYRFMKREERQSILKTKFHFVCKCKPCTLPELQYSEETLNALKCLKCGGAMCYEKIYYCKNCGDKPRHGYLRKVRATQIFEEATRSFDLGKMDDALDKLRTCLYIRKKILYKYNKDILATLVTMAKVYFALGQATNGIKCMNKVIVALREGYGPHGGDLCDQLNTFTDLCLTYLKEESNSNTDTYKSVVKQTEDYLNQLERRTDFKYGSWSKIYEDVKIKQQQIVPFVKYFNT